MKMYIVFLTAVVKHNHGVVEVGRDLFSLSDSVTLLKKDHLQPVTQVHGFCECQRMETP